MLRSKPSVPDSLVLLHGPRAASLLRDIAEAANYDVLKPVSGLTLLILETVQIVKTNREECIRLTERIYELICAIINICGDCIVQLPPLIVTSVTQLTETLQKVLSYVRQQVDASGIMKRLVRHSEHATLLAECNDGIKHSMSLFQVQSSILSASMITEMQRDMEKRYEELLFMIASKEQLMSVTDLNRLRDSASTLSLSPPSPKIFHGRRYELESIISQLSQAAPDSDGKRGISLGSRHSKRHCNLAILGPGGIGKSALALAVLYHSECLRLFQSRRHFISCESAHNLDTLLSTIVSHFALREKGGHATKSILRHLKELAGAGPVLLVLDNFETPWEPLDGRSSVENFLSHLTEVDGVNLILTMRGAERPQNVLWSRPFLPPLLPLTATDARQVFDDICDTAEDEGVLTKLLAKTDYLPLAVTLMANLVSFEGAESVLRRWSSEATSLLSEGYDKRSNLEKSVVLSISSPRMAATPGAKDLLSIVSILPDGLSPSLRDRLQEVIPDINRCLTTLCRTSLGYIDADNRLRALVPIREFTKSTFPPASDQVRIIRSAFYDILGSFANWERTPVTGLLDQIASDLGNFGSLFEYSIKTEESAELRRTVEGVIQLADYTYLTGLGSRDLITSGGFQSLALSLNDKVLEGRLYIQLSRVRSSNTIPIEEYIRKAINCFSDAGDGVSEANAYRQLCYHYDRVNKPMPALEAALKVTSLAGKLGEHGDLSLMAIGLAQESSCFFTLGQNDLALRKAEEACVLARLAGNIATEARTIRQCAFTRLNMGHLERSAQDCTDGMAILEALGMNLRNSHQYRDFIVIVAEGRMRQTEYAEARKHLDILVNHGGFGIDVAYGTLDIITLDNLTGNHADPANTERMHTIRSFFTSYNDVRALGFCDVADGEILMLSGHYNEAKTVLLRVMRNIISTDADILMAAFEKLGNLHWKMGNMELSLRFYILFFAQARKLGDQVGACQAVRCLGDVFQAQGDPDSAKSLWEVALIRFSAMRVHGGIGDSLLRLGDLQKKGGKLDEARRSWEKAMKCFERCPLQQGVDECHRRLQLIKV